MGVLWGDVCLSEPLLPTQMCSGTCWLKLVFSPAVVRILPQTCSSLVGSPAPGLGRLCSLCWSCSACGSCPVPQSSLRCCLTSQARWACLPQPGTTAGWVVLPGGTASCPLTQPITAASCLVEPCSAPKDELPQLNGLWAASLFHLPLPCVLPGHPSDVPPPLGPWFLNLQVPSDLGTPL